MSNPAVDASCVHLSGNNSIRIIRISDSYSQKFASITDPGSTEGLELESKEHSNLHSYRSKSKSEDSESSMGIEVHSYKSISNLGYESSPSMSLNSNTLTINSDENPVPNDYDKNNKYTRPYIVDSNYAVSSMKSSLTDSSPSIKSSLLLPKSYTTHTTTTTSSTTMSFSSISSIGSDSFPIGLPLDYKHTSRHFNITSHSISPANSVTRETTSNNPILQDTGWKTLSNSRSLSIRRRPTVLGIDPRDTVNRYHVYKTDSKDIRNHKLIFKGEEECDSFEKQCFGNARSWDLTLSCSKSNYLPFIMMHRTGKLRCSLFGFNRPEILVADSSGDMIGSVTNPFCCFRKAMQVRGFEGTILYTIASDTSFNKNFCDSTINFKIYRGSSYHSDDTLGEVLYTTCNNSLCSDNTIHLEDFEIFNINFPHGIPPEHKALLLASLFFIEIIYFDNSIDVPDNNRLQHERYTSLMTPNAYSSGTTTTTIIR